MYRDQNSPGGVVETETGETDGRDWGSGDDVTVAVEGGERWRERERRLHLNTCVAVHEMGTCVGIERTGLTRTCWWVWLSGQ